MNHRSKRFGSLAALCALTALTGCGSSSDEPGTGELAVPLATQGPSGTLYRLRDAQFDITSEYYGTGGSGMAGSGGSGGGPTTITVSSEDDPDAPSISVEVPEGSYYVRLHPGWYLERVTDEGAEPVEATLLSGDTQWVWVSRHSTSWAEFQFGLGDRSLWLNGELNINIYVAEDPDDYYGSGGYGGSYGGYGGTGPGSSGGTGVGGGFTAGAAGAEWSSGGTG